MKEIDIFDFDKTVVPFDSGSVFWIYCLIHNPWIVICVPYLLVMMIPFFLGIKVLTYVKKHIYCYVPLINLEKNVKKFWDKHEKDVFEWFRKENRERPAVVISASADFLLEDICSRLGVEKLICSKHDSKTGAIISLNCKNEEKVRRYHEEVSGCKVINVSSDSIKSDRAIFSLGENCFHIQKNGERKPFKYDEMYK